MFLATASTKRPIAMSCLLIALIALGLNSYRKMSLESMPKVDIPYVAIITTWVGASAEDIEKDVSKHIEDAVSGIDGLKHIESSSLENVNQMVLEFNIDVDVDVAAQDVREKLDMVLDQLPADADRPVIIKANINATPIANIFLSGDSPVDELYDYADNVIADRFATVPGVAEVQLIGGNEREVWVELDRDALAAAGLTSLDVAGALQGAILSLPGGRIRQAGNELAVLPTPNTSVKEIRGWRSLMHGARHRHGLAWLPKRCANARSRWPPGRGAQGGQKAEGKPSVVRETHKLEELRSCRQHAADLGFGRVGELIDSVESAWRASGRQSCSARRPLRLPCHIRTTVIVAITMPVTVVISLFLHASAGAIAQWSPAGHRSLDRCARLQLDRRARERCFKVRGAG